MIIGDRTITDAAEEVEALREAGPDWFSAQDNFPDPPCAANTPGALPWDAYVSMEDVIEVTSTSPGTDTITVRLLRTCWPYIAEKLWQIFQQCLKLSHIPACWKVAEVAMIPKVGLFISGGHASRGEVIHQVSRL